MISEEEFLKRYDPDEKEKETMKEIKVLIEKKARSGKVNEITGLVRDDIEQNQTKEKIGEDKIR